MYYLIDGYNILFSASEGDVDFQNFRESVISALQKLFSEKNLSGTIVFDGSHKRDEQSGLCYSSPLIIAYAPSDQTADEYILEKITISKNPKELTVISNDQGLLRQAKSLGARVEKNAPFLKRLSKKKINETEKDPKDSPQNIERLRKIFEKKLEDH